MVDKKDLHEFFKALTEDGEGSAPAGPVNTSSSVTAGVTTPENVVSIMSKPLDDEDDDLKANFPEAKLKEMPHYWVGTHPIDLELETCNTAEEATDRLYTLAAGKEFWGKNGTPFSIPEREERLDWIPTLDDDGNFKLMLAKLGLAPYEIISNMYKIAKKKR